MKIYDQLEMLKNEISSYDYETDKKAFHRLVYHLVAAQNCLKRVYEFESTLKGLKVVTSLTSEWGNGSHSKYVEQNEKHMNFMFQDNLQRSIAVINTIQEELKAIAELEGDPPKLWTKDYVPGLS